MTGIVALALVISAGLLIGQGGPHAALTIDYPVEGSIFPPEMVAPTFLWHDPVNDAALWRIDVSFADGAEPIHAMSQGDPPPMGEIDPRAVAKTNMPPVPGPREAGAHAWQPAPDDWEAIKKHAVDRAVTVTVIVRGFRDVGRVHGTGEAAAADAGRMHGTGEAAAADAGRMHRTGATAATDAGRDHPVSSGRLTFSVSKDRVGAPIFYRDVPLMPSAAENGVIKPLPSAAVPLVGWRLRDISQPRSRLLLEGLPTCANCHSFSRDGKTMGIDVDGAENDKGTYAIAPVAPQTTIRKEDVITWNAFPDKPAGHRTIGFMSQLSPDGRYAVTTVNEALYVANFTDYRFLQVFYPTRGILAWYDRTTGRMQALPGANDPRYVHTNGVWSPDGSYLVFARAAARDPYPAGSKLAAYAGDPNEVPIQYDLYRIPFHDGKGGQPEPIEGASHNGMSNAFPKISPDGRWIVFVECRNGQLMRPDGQLYIVPAAGGRARRMHCNTPLMNSWHSFSPNGRWLVFSSKSRSPYTQMFLTHLDENGNDSPAVLIENSTAANRAVNIPEFVNIPPDGLLHIDVPAAEFYRRFDHALELSEKGQHDAAITEWNKALEIDPDDPKAHSNLGAELARAGRVEEAVLHLRRAVELRPEFAQAHYNLGGALLRSGRLEEAITSFRRALVLIPTLTEAHHELGVALARQGRPEEAVAQLEEALKEKPGFAPAHNDLGIALLGKGKAAEAAAHFERAIEITPGFAEAHYNLAVVYIEQRKPDQAAGEFRKALELRPTYAEAEYGLGKICYARDKIREALDHWFAALERMPDDLNSLKAVAWVLAVNPDAAFRDGRKAVQLAERALRLSGATDPAVLDIVAAAYAESARYPEAVKLARQAVALSTRSRRPSLAEAAKARAALYESGNPYRDQRLP